jgi:hypothetical protein
LPLLFKYPITRKSHAVVKAKLEAMDKANVEEAPVRTL